MVHHPVVGVQGGGACDSAATYLILSNARRGQARTPTLDADNGMQMDSLLKVFNKEE